jgi:hypothetical protein
VVHLDLGTGSLKRAFFIHSWRYVGVFFVLHSVHENMELCARELVVSAGLQAEEAVAQKADEHFDS